MFGVVSIYSQQSIKNTFFDITQTKTENYGLSGFLPLSLSSKTQKGSVYADMKSSPEKRTFDLISRMNFEEKLVLTGGYNGFNIAGVPRLGIRPVTMADASQGIRTSTIAIKDKSVSFPGLLPLASTWNKDLARKFGENMGEECRALGVDILLGPGINIQRLSVGGRNFEYMGEDPLLTAEMATAYILGLQSKNIIPTAKHFICNDQDFCRHIVSIEVDERTLREIYLRPWEAIIKNAGCMGIMTGNNSVNSIPCVMNKSLNMDILRHEFGFNGLAMSDWQNSQYFPQRQNLVLPSGHNILMPSNQTFANWLNKEIEKHPNKKQEIEKQLENMIYPTIYTLFKMGVYDRKPQDSSYINSRIKRQLFARKVAEEAIVLLKNDDNILPVKKGKKIVFIGQPEIYSGNGSGFVEGFDHISYEQGLKNIYGEDFKAYNYLNVEEVKKADIVFFNLNKKSGEGADYPFNESIKCLDTLRLIVELNKNIVVLANAANTFPTDWLSKVKGFIWCSYLGQERGNALADIICGKVSPSGKIPFSFEKDFNDSADPKFNYIGNKPFWKGNNQYKNYWLGKDSSFVSQFTNNVKQGEYIPVNYSEGIFVGYRWFDSRKKDVVFPFGYGLSYTQFKYDNLKCENKWLKNGKVILKATITNIGKMEGKEIVQLYVSDKKCTVPRPLKELKGFQKIDLKAGERREVVFELTKDAFSFWSIKNHQWVVEPGEFEIRIGSSSCDLPLKTSVILN